jgi:hypothetical protein
MGISHPGNGAGGARGGVRSLWSLTLRCVSDLCKPQILCMAGRDHRWPKTSALRATRSCRLNSCLGQVT